MDAYGENAYQDHDWTLEETNVYVEDEASRPRLRHILQDWHVRVASEGSLIVSVVSSPLISIPMSSLILSPTV